MRHRTATSGKPAVVSRPRSVIMRHPPIKTWDPASMLEWSRALLRAAEEFASIRGVDPTQIPSKQREQLLRSISEVISVERFERLWLSQDQNEQKKIAQDIRDEVLRLLETTLLQYSPATRRGAKRKFKERDQRMYEMRLAGYSYGKIAQRFRTNRMVAVSACRRIEAHHREFLETYSEVRNMLEQIGITLEEERPMKATPSS